MRPLRHARPGARWTATPPRPCGTPNRRPRKSRRGSRSFSTFPRRGRSETSRAARHAETRAARACSRSSSSTRLRSVSSTIVPTVRLGRRAPPSPSKNVCDRADTQRTPPFRRTIRSSTSYVPSPSGSCALRTAAAILSRSPGWTRSRNSCRLALLVGGPAEDAAQLRRPVERIAALIVIEDADLGCLDGLAQPLLALPQLLLHLHGDLDAFVEPGLAASEVRAVLGPFCSPEPECRDEGQDEEKGADQAVAARAAAQTGQSLVLVDLRHECPVAGRDLPHGGQDGGAAVVAEHAEPRHPSAERRRVGVAQRMAQRQGRSRVVAQRSQVGCAVTLASDEVRLGRPRSPDSQRQVGMEPAARVLRDDHRAHHGTRAVAHRLDERHPDRAGGTPAEVGRRLARRQRRARRLELVEAIAPVRRPARRPAASCRRRSCARHPGRTRAPSVPERSRLRRGVRALAGSPHDTVARPPAGLRRPRRRPAAGPSRSGSPPPGRRPSPHDRAARGQSWLAALTRQEHQGEVTGRGTKDGRRQYQEQRPSTAPAD